MSSSILDRIRSIGNQLHLTRDHRHTHLVTLTHPVDAEAQFRSETSPIPLPQFFVCQVHQKLEELGLHPDHIKISHDEQAQTMSASAKVVIDEGLALTVWDELDELTCEHTTVALVSLKHRRGESEKLEREDYSVHEEVSRTFTYGNFVEVTHTLLHNGRRGTVIPISDHPDDPWDYYVKLEATTAQTERIIGVFTSQIVLVEDRVSPMIAEEASLLASRKSRAS